MTLAEAVARAGEVKDERALADLRREVDDDLEAAARSQNYQERAVAYRAIGKRSEEHTSEQQSHSSIS